MSSVRLSVTVGDYVIYRIFMKIGIVFRNKFLSKCESWVLPISDNPTYEYFKGIQ